MNETTAHLRARVLVHATAVALADAAVPFGGHTDGAVLLFGESGAGKSDVALRLIAAGAKLVSDDQTALFVESGRVFAEAPANLRGKLEVRGLGILEVDCIARSPVILAVKLENGARIARLPDAGFYALPAGLEGGVNPPLLTLNASEASTPAKIAAAAAGFARGGFVGWPPPS
jgi:HPr kinase/phosphorylase